MKITLSDMVAKGVEYVVPNNPGVTIGRNQDGNSIVIPDRKYRTSLDEPKKLEFDKVARTISGHHCMIHQHPKKAPYITDNNSKNGTTIRGATLSKEMNAVLYNGDELLLGDYKLIVKIE